MRHIKKRPMSSMTCWECGRPAPVGVCPGPHTFGRLEYNQAVSDGQVEIPERRLMPIAITGLPTVKLRAELGELEILRRKVQKALQRAS